MRHVNAVGIAEDSIVGLHTIKSYTKFLEKPRGNFGSINQSEYVTHPVVVISVVLCLGKTKETHNRQAD